MNDILDLFMGDPIYDERKRVVGRDFGVKNIIAIVIVLYIGNLLMCKMKPKSGKGRMKGGSGKDGKGAVAVGPEPLDLDLDPTSAFILVVIVGFWLFWLFFWVLSKIPGTGVH